MALQGKIIACGTSLTIFGMVLRFIAGPAAMTIGAIAVGLHGDVLRVAIIQVVFAFRCANHSCTLNLINLKT